MILFNYIMQQDGKQCYFFDIMRQFKVLYKILFLIIAIFITAFSESQYFDGASFLIYPSRYTLFLCQIISCRIFVQTYQFHTGLLFQILLLLSIRFEILRFSQMLQTHKSFISSFCFLAPKKRLSLF